MITGDHKETAIAVAKELNLLESDFHYPNRSRARSNR